LAAESLITNAETGERCTIADIVERGLRFNVWAVNEQLRLVQRPIVDAWQVGRKQVHRVTTQSGRVIRCTEGHRFLTVSGWSELKDLAPGRAIAVPRILPEPASRKATMSPDRALLLGWLTGDGHFGGSPTLTVATAYEAAAAVTLAQSAFALQPIVKPERASTTALRVIMTTGRMCGAGENPLTNWLRRLGVWKSTGERKHVPDELFAQCDAVVAAFLRGIFHADGCLMRGATSSRVTVRLSTISESLAYGVQHLLLRFGINAMVKSDRRHIGGYRTKTTAIWTVALMQRGSVNVFMDRIGFLGEKQAVALSKIDRIVESDAGQFDRIPLEVNARVRSLRLENGLSHAALGWRDQGKAMSRATCAMLSERLDDSVLDALALSDVLWDSIASIEAEGEERVYDLTVGELHNFCVNDIVTHNSGAIEQEADLVTFLYRDAYYNRETTPDPDLTEFIIAKHRNGKVGTVRLRFLQEHTLFVPYGDESHFAGP
jgi:replicative DNA helicase